MSTERMEVLQMLAEGKITAVEAEQLLAALDAKPAETAAAADEPRAKPRLKYLRVQVDSRDGEGPARVNVRVPLQLLRAGVKLASLIPPQVVGQANEELRKNGVSFDLNQLKPEQLDDLIEHLGDLTVEVDDPDNKVRVFCE